MNKLNSNEPITIENEVTKNIEKYQPNEIVTIRVRTETGKKTLILKLLVSDKMASVYKFISPYIENKGRQFEVRTTFPNKAYPESETKTLKELGLAPSSAVVIQLK